MIQTKSIIILWGITATKEQIYLENLRQYDNIGINYSNDYNWI